MSRQEGGNKGGRVVFEGTPMALLKAKQSLTSQYLQPSLTRGDDRVAVTRA